MKSKPKGAKYRNLVAYRGRIFYDRVVGGRRYWRNLKETDWDDAIVLRDRFERLNLRKDIGMTCGGEVALFFEVYHPDLVWHIVVFGAGHVGQKLCRFLAELDCRVTCVDTRADWLEKLPAGGRIETRHVAHYHDGVDQLSTGLLRHRHDHGPQVRRAGPAGDRANAALKSLISA